MIALLTQPTLPVVHPPSPHARDHLLESDFGIECSWWALLLLKFNVNPKVWDHLYPEPPYFGARVLDFVYRCGVPDLENLRYLNRDG